MQRPAPTEYANFYANYVNKIIAPDGIDALEQTGFNFVQFCQTLPQEIGTYRYLPSKWSVNELILHCIDTEIIFVARALRIAREDNTPLPGFNQDPYVAASKADYLQLAEIVKLFTQTRTLTINLFKTIPSDAQTNSTLVDGNPMTLRALAFIISGHAEHHLQILKERYV